MIMAKKSDFNTSRSVKDLQAEYGKMPPQAVDLEEAVLGALMLERDAFSIVGDLLEPDAFYKDAHQKIFRAIHKLFLNDDPVDLLTVSEALKQSGELEQVGGYYYLSQLTTRVASAAHIEFHAKIIVICRIISLEDSSRELRLQGLWLRNLPLCWPMNLQVTSIRKPVQMLWD